MRETILMMAWAMIGTAFFVFFALKMGLTAGYGRYTNQAQWGINPKLAWFIQESPAFFIPFYFLFGGLSSTGRILNCIFLVHYFYRFVLSRKWKKSVKVVFQGLDLSVPHPIDYKVSTLNCCRCSSLLYIQRDLARSLEFLLSTGGRIDIPSSYWYVFVES